MHRAGACFIAGVLLAQGSTLTGSLVAMWTAKRTESALSLGAMSQRVDRTHKGDRLIVPVGAINNEPESYAPEKIMVGCDPVFSLLLDAHVNFPGRCAT
jgi:hypothetical protein